jgi:glycosyltransferase involved in cell wall biosynthesis
MSRKILFFIESLRSGGKERRLVELLYFLKQNTDFKIKLALTEDQIHYSSVRNLGIPIEIIERHRLLKKDPSLFFRFYSIAREFNPDIIHAWGIMTTFYAIPAKLFLKRSLITNLIADSKKNYNRFSLTSIFLTIDCFFADLILGNSEAGFKAYGVDNHKKRLIYNGVQVQRFNINIDKQKIRNELHITTPYMIIM